MVVQNITIKVSHSAAQAMIGWLAGYYSASLAPTMLFSGFKLCRLLDQDETEGATLVWQLYLSDTDLYHAFQQSHAAPLRSAMQHQFGDTYIAFHTLMEVLDASAPLW